MSERNHSQPVIASDAPAARVDWMNLVALEKYGMPEGWQWFRAEVKNHSKPSSFILLTGAVCSVLFERGKRKGQQDWSKRDKATEAVIAIQHNDIDQLKLAWQQRTGKCHVCQGTGQYVYGWDHKDGDLKRPCDPCGATGNNPEALS